MKKIKVCFIINNLKQGGAERQFVELIKNINKELFDVELCIYSYSDKIFYSEIIEEKQIKITLNKLKARTKMLKIIEAIIFLNKFLSIGKYDIIQTTLFMNGLLVRIAGITYRDRIISTIRNSFVIYKSYHRIIEKILLSRSYVVANTQKAAEEFKKIVSKNRKQRVFSIPNGIDCSKYKKNEKEPLLDHKIIIGNVGRITFQKNQIQLCRVIKNIDANLIILGEKESEYENINNFILSNKLESKVSIVEKTLKPEEYYKIFDIFVLSSHWEGCPNVLLEAMLSGCFCIISKSANTDNFIKHNENGYVYDGSDYDLENKIKEAIVCNQNNTSNRIIEAGINYVMKNYSINKMVKSYEKIYCEIYSKMA